VRAHIPLPFKLMLSYLFVAALITLPAFWLLRRSLTESIETAEGRELKARAEALRPYLSALSGTELHDAVRRYAELLDVRITLVDATGRVISDSTVAPDRLATLESHADRPEVRGAFSSGFGSDVRKSTSLSEELVYAAIPLEREGQARSVLRLAVKRAAITSIVRDALLALRVGVGIGISAALVLSLIAAFYVSSPLRRMREVAHAYSEARWIDVHPKQTGDEIEELWTALASLGTQLRQQLVSAGEREALLAQAVERLPVGAATFDPLMRPLAVSAALRERLGWTAATEASGIAALAAEITRSGLTEGGHALERIDGRGLPVRLRALPLHPADGAPFWIVAIDDPTIRDDRASAILRSLEQADQRPNDLAQRDAVALALAEAATPPSTTERQKAHALVQSAIKLVNAERTTPHLVDGMSSNDDLVADPAGWASRTLRVFFRGVAKAHADSKSIAISVATDGTWVRVSADRALQNLAEVRAALRMVGGESGTTPTGGTWLRLPRA
jgi:HAMP domain-containing protein